MSRQSWLALTFPLMVTFLLVVACAGKRPILSANDHLREVGREAADADIDACIALIHEIRDGSYDARADVAATIGFIAWTAASAGGDTGDRSSDRNQPYERCAASACTEEGYRRAVEACLEQKGYRTVVWR